MSEFLKSFYVKLLRRAMLNRVVYLITSAMIFLIILASLLLFVLFNYYSIIFLALVFPCYLVRRKTVYLNFLYDSDLNAFKWSSIGNPPLSDINIPFALCPINGMKEISSGCYLELKSYLTRSSFNEVFDYVSNLITTNKVVTYRDLCQIIIYTEAKKIWFKKPSCGTEPSTGAQLFTN